MIVKLPLLLLAVLSAWAAEVCPPGGPAVQGAQPGVLAWNSYRGEVRKKVCIGSEVRNVSPKPLPLSWPEAGIEQTLLQGNVQVSLCCFDAEEARPSTLSYGDPPTQLPVTLRAPAEEGLADHEEGYPDLIEDDARVRTMAIRGTLRAVGEILRVDLVLKCSASQFAKQFAYQFSITDRSADPVELDWDLLRDLRARMSPSLQPIPNGKTYIFLTSETPREATSVLVLKTKSGLVAGRFRFDAFTAGH